MTLGELYDRLLALHKEQQKLDRLQALLRADQSSVSAVENQAYWTNVLRNTDLKELM